MGPPGDKNAELLDKSAGLFDEKAAKLRDDDEVRNDEVPKLRNDEGAKLKNDAAAKLRNEESVGLLVDRQGAQIHTDLFSCATVETLFPGLGIAQVSSVHQLRLINS